jgi:hypothetical protein
LQRAVAEGLRAAARTIRAVRDRAGAEFLRLARHRLAIATALFKLQRYVGEIVESASN